MLIILNHKMNLTIKEIKAYEEAIRDYNVVLMPQTPYMGLFTNGKYILGSQCISEYNATGGVSVDALVHLNVKYVLVGHFERRNINRDTDEIIKFKIKELLKNNILPILCISDNEENNHLSLINQIDNVFKMNEINLSKILIAYEPINYIGTNQNINLNMVKEKILFIKKYITENYSTNNQVLYGGSVNSNNVTELKELKIIDGLLIGSASLNINEVINIYNKINN